MREYVDILTRVSETTGAAVVFIHHAGKGSPDDPRDLGRGSSALFDACGAVYALRRSKTPKTIEVEMTKTPASAEGQRVEDFGLEFVDMPDQQEFGSPISVEYRALDPRRNDTNDPDAEFSQTRSALLDLLRREPGQGINALAPRVGKQKALVQSVLAALVDDGTLVTKPGPKNAKLYFLISEGGSDGWN
jgi:hypothetical protein